MEMRPLSQSWQAVAPASPLKVPTVHRRHGVAASASWSCVPATQEVQAPEPMAAYEPGAQRPSQVAVPLSSENRPAAQGTQAVAALPSWSTWPATQAWHSDAPFAAYAPALQDAHSTASAVAEKVPAAHGAHHPPSFHVPDGHVPLQHDV